MATDSNVKTKQTKIIHAFGGMGFSYCGKKVSTKIASGDPDDVTCPTCRKEMGE